MQTTGVSEAFHLAFLTALRSVVDPRHFILKGGGNLRFYYGSLRFSEDIDLDVVGTRSDIFTDKMAKAFASPLLARLLSSQGIRVVELNAKDQTSHKEKWMVGLSHPDLELPARTRVELSYPTRNPIACSGDAELAGADPRIANAYPTLPAPWVYHYLPAAAVCQKILALQERTVAQARDVFDLDFLSSGFPAALARGSIANAVLDGASERTLEITYEQYAAKVVTFLDLAVQEAYRDPRVWSQIQDRLLGYLGGLRS